MRFSKPTIDWRAPARVILLFGIYLVAGCYTPPARLERAHEPDEVYRRASGFETRLRVLSANELLDRSRFLNAELARQTAFTLRIHPADRAPHLLALQVSVFNYGERPALIDFRRFRLRPQHDGTGQLQTPLQAAEFRRRFRGWHTGTLFFDFAFAQKEIHAFESPVPDWYMPLGPTTRASSENTAAATEIATAQSRRDRYQNTLHTKRSVVPAGGETRGIVLFEASEHEREQYVLSYATETRQANAGGLREFVFLPFEFQRTLRRVARNAESDDQTHDAQTRAERYNEPYRLWRAGERMHEQLRTHDRLRPEADSEAR